MNLTQKRLLTNFLATLIILILFVSFYCLLFHQKLSENVWISLKKECFRLNHRYLDIMTIKSIWKIIFFTTKLLKCQVFENVKG